MVKCDASTHAHTSHRYVFIYWQNSVVANEIVVWLLIAVWQVRPFDHCSPRQQHLIHTIFINIRWNAIQVSCSHLIIKTWLHLTRHLNVYSRKAYKSIGRMPFNYFHINSNWFHLWAMIYTLQIISINGWCVRVCALARAPRACVRVTLNHQCIQCEVRYRKSVPKP